ncbi:MAG TPA: hypothetical protein VM537_25100 [Anaerolineae bacterium]|nr:hypothetical protein [Anaerolineae bacterium]
MHWFGDSQDSTDDVRELALEAQEGLDALDALEELPREPEKDEWVDRGIRDVPIADLPEPEDIHGDDDFKKVSEDEMRVGLDRLQEMQPIIDSQEGVDSDYWGRFDEQRGLDYEHGYRRVYDAFYGQDSVRLAKDGDQYDIINGRHRIWLAKKTGIETLPARVIGRRKG